MFAKIFVQLTVGLEQTIVPTLGSYLPEVVPLMLVKWTSEMVMLLCIVRKYMVSIAKRRVDTEGRMGDNVRGTHCTG